MGGELVLDDNQWRDSGAWWVEGVRAKVSTIDVSHIPTQTLDQMIA